MPAAGTVEVIVFDLLGRNVLSMPQREYTPGKNHKLVLDASNLASGSYVYQLVANLPDGPQQQLGRMTLVK